MAKQLQEPLKREALALLAQGKPKAEVARLTGLSRNTVKQLAKPAQVIKALEASDYARAMIQSMACNDAVSVYNMIRDEIALNDEEGGATRLAAGRYLHELAGVSRPGITPPSSGMPPMNVTAEQIQFLIQTEKEVVGDNDSGDERD